MGQTYPSPAVTDDDSPTAWDVIAAARRFHHVLQGRLDRALEGCGLSYAQYEVIEMLAAEPKLHAGELGRRLRISRQAAHGLLAQLARADLVELLPRDGTSRGAWLTRRGRRRLAACRRALHGTERALTALPAGARRGLLQAMGAAETGLAPRPQPWWLE